MVDRGSCEYNALDQPHSLAFSLSEKNQLMMMMMVMMIMMIIVMMMMMMTMKAWQISSLGVPGYADFCGTLNPWRNSISLMMMMTMMVMTSMIMTTILTDDDKLRL